MTVRDQTILENIDPEYYSRRRLRWDDYFALVGSVILPAAYFVFWGAVWVLPVIAVCGYLWAKNAGSTDFENSIWYWRE